MVVSALVILGVVALLVTSVIYVVARLHVWLHLGD
jgi:hypothetical protein